MRAKWMNENWYRNNKKKIKLKYYASSNQIIFFLTLKSNNSKERYVRKWLPSRIKQEVS